MRARKWQGRIGGHSRGGVASFERCGGFSRCESSAIIFRGSYERDEERERWSRTGFAGVGTYGVEGSNEIGTRSSAHDLGKCREREHGWTNLTREHVSTNWIRWI